MSAPRRRNNRARPGGSKQQPAADIWRPALPLAEIRPIAAPEAPSALLLSLGDPPVANGANMAGYFVAVSERAAATATALAISADLLAGPGDEPEGPARRVPASS
jgi:hypothetical protein